MRVVSTSVESSNNVVRKSESVESCSLYVVARETMDHIRRMETGWSGTPLAGATGIGVAMIVVNAQYEVGLLLPPGLMLRTRQ
jgi:hypothetical protein